jgi:hypothetical protein
MQPCLACITRQAVNSLSCFYDACTLHIATTIIYTYPKDMQTLPRVIDQLASTYAKSNHVTQSILQKDHINETIATIQAHLNQTLKYATPHPQCVIIIQNQYWNTINICICTIRSTSAVGYIDAPHRAPMCLSSLQGQQRLHASLTQPHTLIKQRVGHLPLRLHLAAIRKDRQRIAKIITNATQTMTQYFHETCSPLLHGGAA